MCRCSALNWVRGLFSSSPSFSPPPRGPRSPSSLFWGARCNVTLKYWSKTQKAITGVWGVECSLERLCQVGWGFRELIRGNSQDKEAMPGTEHPGPDFQMSDWGRIRTHSLRELKEAEEGLHSLSPLSCRKCRGEKYFPAILLGSWLRHAQMNRRKLHLITYAWKPHKNIRLKDVTQSGAFIHFRQRNSMWRIDKTKGFGQRVVEWWRSNRFCLFIQTSWP